MQRAESRYGGGVCVDCRRKVFKVFHRGAWSTLLRALDAGLRAGPVGGTEESPLGAVPLARNRDQESPISYLTVRDHEPSRNSDVLVQLDHVQKAGEGSL